MTTKQQKRQRKAGKKADEVKESKYLETKTERKGQHKKTQTNI